MTTTTRVLKIGMIGIGVGGAEILPAMEAMDTVDLVAGADVVPETLTRFKQRFPQAKTYDSAAALCRDPDVEAVWVSSPNRFHAEHAILAANSGKHVVVEKPMAISLAEAGAMVQAADKNSVKLLAGHTMSFSAPIRAMHKIIRSGKLGRLCALNLSAFTDWMLRPRTADELDVTQGGGIPFRQGPHQVDTVRLLGGGMLRTVRAQVGQWLPQRPIPGYYAAFLEFVDGTPAVITYNGYGYFLGAEMVPWGEDKQRYTLPERIEVRRALRGGTRNEADDKQALRIGGSQDREVFSRSEHKAWVPHDLGFLVASCELGDLRQSPMGVYIHDDSGKREIDTTGRQATGVVQRRAELQELYDAVVLGQPLWHDGRWGMATLEVCLAIMDSARGRTEVVLEHQVPVHADHDVDFEVPGF